MLGVGGVCPCGHPSWRRWSELRGRLLAIAENPSNNVVYRQVWKEVGVVVGVGCVGRPILSFQCRLVGASSLHPDLLEGDGVCPKLPP